MPIVSRTKLSLLSPDGFPAASEDDTLAFRCTQCGECCFEQTVLLDPEDVWRLAQHAAVTAAALLADGRVRLVHDGIWHAALGQASAPGRPCRYLLPVFAAGGDAVVRFGCALHETPAKPLVCRLSPLAKVHGEAGFRVVPPVTGCPGMHMGSPRPVAEWVASAGPERMAFRAWFVGWQQDDRRFAERAFVARVFSTRDRDQLEALRYSG